MNHADILKVLGEQSRLRIMRLLLATKKEICGCEFVDSLELPQYNLTKHIDILIHARLVKSRKEGRWVYYFACHDNSPFCHTICEGILKAKDQIYEKDLMRFKGRMALRQKGKCLLGIQNKKFVN
ncbi:MAG: winged helix-turn-helix transcriptional regulator [Candidatus Omnitrophica bacterium]|nr:winged helix-turn-helix transcriptional regulator [Candidatus Omnitrophota bacterium]